MVFHFDPHPYPVMKEVNSEAANALIKSQNGFGDPEFFCQAGQVSWTRFCYHDLSLKKTCWCHPTQFQHYDCLCHYWLHKPGDQNKIYQPMRSTIPYHWCYTLVLVNPSLVVPSTSVIAGHISWVFGKDPDLKQVWIRQFPSKLGEAMPKWPLVHWF